MKLGGHVGCVTRKNLLNFSDDPNPDPDLIIVSPRKSGDNLV